MTGSGDLPLSVDGVTAEWLTAALRTRRPDVTVTSARQVEVIEGTATKVLVELAYHGDEDGLPALMWVKGGFAAHRELVGALGIYAGEARFFDAIAPAYRLHCPRSYFAVAQDDPVQGIVGLEDLRGRGATFARATRPLSVAQAAAGLETLASLHAQTWCTAGLTELGVPMVVGPATDSFIDGWLAALPTYFAAARGYAAPVALHDPDRLRAGTHAYHEFVQSGPACLLHADSHVGNCYLEPDGSVGFVDWQTVATGRWVHDVNYFVVSALDVPDRRLHERDLLGHYLAALAAHGAPAPAAAEAWDDYRRSTVYGFLCWLCNPDGWQLPDVNTATYARFGTAMLDHDTYAVLGV